jgi:hypothetical protein
MRSGPIASPTAVLRYLLYDVDRIIGRPARSTSSGPIRRIRSDAGRGIP